MGDLVRHDAVNVLDVDLKYALGDWAALHGGVMWQQRAVDETALKSAEFDDVTISLASTFTY